MGKFSVALFPHRFFKAGYNQMLSYQDLWLTIYWQLCFPAASFIGDLFHPLPTIFRTIKSWSKPGRESSKEHS